ncbi:MAG: hypothetical protein GY696_16720 [Gammaproteobacteria bacterium]|nr:hypothetical protein [Gammaproteobacteria bacterium]
MSSKSAKIARRKAKCNQDASLMLNRDTGGQPSVLPPVAVDPCAEVTAPPPPLVGKGVCPPPPLPTEGSPTRINKFARPTACDPFAADEEVATRTTFEVLTLPETREVSGWSCEWRYRCGLFSHMKLSGVTHLLRHSLVTGADCRGMVRRQEYIPEGRAVGLPLRLVPCQPGQH